MASRACPTSSSSTRRCRSDWLPILTFCRLYPKVDLKTCIVCRVCYTTDITAEPRLVWLLHEAARQFWYHNKPQAGYSLCIRQHNDCKNHNPERQWQCSKSQAWYSCYMKKLRHVPTGRAEHDEMVTHQPCILVIWRTTQVPVAYVCLWVCLRYMCLCRDSLTQNTITALESKHSSCVTSQGKQSLNLHSHDSENQK